MVKSICRFKTDKFSVSDEFETDAGWRGESARGLAQSKTLHARGDGGFRASFLENIERSDIATPDTFVRYTGNWQGSYEGWLPTPRILARRIPYTLPRLKMFYMAGHWVVAGGGLASAALAGRYAAQMVCAQYGKMFAATKP